MELYMKSTEVFLSVITPSYNRSNELKNLYYSLQSQTCFNFAWIIVDDGRTDDTNEIVSTFNTNLFKINYVSQENSGKHRAINYISENLNSECLFIVDSDDILTSDAIETIYYDWYNAKEEIIGLSYLRIDIHGNTIGDEFTSDNLYSTHVTERIINYIRGDKAEIWKTSEFNRIPFLEFEGERFFSEQHKYLALSGKGKILFRNKAIYISEYLKGGLSSIIRILQFENPSGTLANSVALTNRFYPLKTRLKAFLMIFAFSRISGVQFLTVFRDCDYELQWLLLTPIGLLYHRFVILYYNFHNQLYSSR